LQGNILDLAIGIIIGTAFQNVVKSLVDDIITPPFGLIFDGVDFSNLTIKMPNFVHKGQPPVVIRYGLFLQQIIHLLVLAFALFGIVKLISRLRRIAAQNRQRAEANEPTQPSEPPEPSEEVKLLRNIRDLLEEIRNVNVPQSIASSSIESSSNLIHL
jgi:large conductance mechanosensitive channel